MYSHDSQSKNTFFESEMGLPDLTSSLLSNRKSLIPVQVGAGAFSLERRRAGMMVLKA